MLTKNGTTNPHTFSMARFVPVGNVEAELARNPSAKVFREIVMTVSKDEVQIQLGSVTREAAVGGYRNGSINNVTVTLPMSEFLSAPDLTAASIVLASESYAVISKIMQIRAEMAKESKAIFAVLGIMENV